ncbi:MAG TPA: tRNA 2-thiocytidine(32) synthetase TtcA [Candidatus Polarisedimenticolaceae bacterium]|nr:tRNA 2-thiocytidine(32) synthetase TtcA [Candidatus Polarisedimenticolaceae bacterium]
MSLDLLTIVPEGYRAAREAKPPERLRTDLARTVAKTIHEHALLREGDRVLVAVSGGKDSYTMLDLLEEARRKSPVKFTLVAFHLDQAQPGYDGTALRAWLQASGVPFEIHREDTYSAVLADAEEHGGGRTYCRLCSRLRRGIMYSAAERLGCNKIALGHHRDDALETFLLNLLYAGRLQAMPPIYTTNDDKFEVIRPLIECAEDDIAAWAGAAGYPIVPCNLCGSQANLKRDAVAALLADLERRIPNVRSVMLAALGNVRPSHLLDREVAEAWAAKAADYPDRR